MDNSMNNHYDASASSNYQGNAQPGYSAQGYETPVTQNNAQNSNGYDNGQSNAQAQSQPQAQQQAYAQPHYAQTQAQSTQAQYAQTPYTQSPYMQPPVNYPPMYTGASARPRVNVIVKNRYVYNTKPNVAVAVLAVIGMVLTGMTIAVLYTFPDWIVTDDSVMQAIIVATFAIAGIVLVAAGIVSAIRLRAGKDNAENVDNPYNVANSQQQTPYMNYSHDENSGASMSDFEYEEESETTQLPETMHEADGESAASDDTTVVMNRVD
ncbi:hypothetical protein EJ419_02955 [Alloscardovia theropitheci]|uniref:Uncharacterized protein n=1 Tax=Alloscardovia theropitheci TaxID=2496842 RepID=A0A4R0QQJ9_9BIFI|nr:hypothetical protein [Alloscardovia theropitheci]TCD54574.1 hypothetical protein EJ419_02955 [Alloscardovia theropitheci]